MSSLLLGNYAALVRGVDENEQELRNLLLCSVTLSYVKDDIVTEQRETLLFPSQSCVRGQNSWAKVIKT